MHQAGHIGRKSDNRDKPAKSLKIERPYSFALRIGFQKFIKFQLL